MCAINGFNFNDETLIAKMNLATKHRGPDGSGVFCDDNVSLGHNRLSIIDLSSAAGQPMTSGNGRYTIVFNGEIYNYRELKKELGDYSFKTASDTEVILAAYEKWGEDCVKKFNGIFAFAIWDLRERALFLARDPIGVKPLYYYHSENQFIFSSEIKAILEHNVPRFIDHEALSIYFRALYVPEPLTMFRGIKKMPPAHLAKVKDGDLVLKKYWEFGRQKNPSIKYGEAAGLLRDKIAAAVERQLVSDRPLGIYLSGGIDSSAVLDSASRVRSNIDTFSVGFELSDREDSKKFNEDFYLARRTAAHYGTNHNEVMLTSADVLDTLDKAIWHLDEPISNPTIIPMMKLATFAKNKVAVALGGDGGDELFGGYERYRLSLIADHYQRLPASVRSLLSRNDRLRKLNVPAGIERYALFMFQKDEQLRQILNGSLVASVATKDFFNDKYGLDRGDLNFTETLMNVDRESWLVDFALTMTDKASMSAGLEIRIPLLDQDVVEFATTLPLRYKVGLLGTKLILKEAFRGHLPDFLYGQPKRGWFSPGAKWLRQSDIYELARDVFSDAYYREMNGLFKTGALPDLLARHRAGEYHLNTLWSALTFRIWAKKFNVSL